jgi:hypothetical protein
MTRYLLALGFICATAILFGQDTNQVEATFITTEIDLGEIVRGESRDTVFTFTNTGSEDLVIEIASGCECTELDWTRGKIAPGEEGVINVHFDSTTKEYEEVIEVDVNFENTNPETGGPYFRILEYTYTFKE